MSGLIAGLMASTRAKYGLALAMIMGIAFFIRVYFPYDHVFAGDWVRFQETDAWFHMQVVENLVHNFPQRMSYDPFTYFPVGQVIGTGPMFDYLLGSIIWVLGVGSPSKGLTETIGAYFPAILGALVTLPVFFLGKELFNKKAGILAAGLIAILPGEYMYRSLLGFTDHHIAEVLFSTTAMLFFILALKSARGAGVSFGHVRSRDWSVLRRPLIWSVLAGIALGFYLLTWSGGAVFLLIIFAFAIVQYIIDHLRGRSTDYLAVVGVPALAIALLLILPAANGYTLWDMHVASLVIGIIAFAALGAAATLMIRRGIKPVYYPLAIAGLMGVGLLLFWLIAPDVLASLLDRLGVLTPSGGKLTVSEAHGMSLSSAWDFFTTGFWLSVASGLWLIYIVVKEGTADKTLLLVWSLIMLVAAFGQQRFAYYLAVNVALLTAFLSWKILELAGLRESAAEAEAEAQSADTVMRSERDKPRLTKKAKRKKAAQRRRQAAPRGSLLRETYAVSLLILIAVFFLAFYPNIGKAIEWAEPRYGPSDDWHEALSWMQQNTPDPFGDPSSYYESHQKPPPGEDYPYPESAYGVMAWWDPGNWITYMAHRIPNASPRGQKGAPDAADFLLAQDEASANEVLDRLGSRYVILEAANAIIQLTASGVRGEFQAYAIWADQDPRDYYDVYYQAEGGSLAPVLVYHPPYYRSMISRLYLNFGREWVPVQTDVVSVEDRTVSGSEGQDVKIKVITDLRTFDSYDEAVEFLKANDNYRIIGTRPHVSPVPLEAMESYELVHKSPATVVSRGADTISEVEIFEYSP